MEAGRYRFGEFTLDLGRATLSRGGVDLPLRPKSFQVLRHLVLNADRLVTREELGAAVWPRTVVTDESLTRCISDIRAALGPDALDAIKTVARRGYRFVSALTPGDSQAPDMPTVPAEQATASRQPGWPRKWRAASLALLGVAALAFALAWATARRDAAAPLRLVVVPFASVTDEADHQYLGDVIAADLAGALARLRGTTVIAAESARTLKGAPVDLARLASEWGVRYAVQGSVVPNGQRLRISARLTDTSGAASLWSDEFDLDRRDLIRTLDEIVLRLASAMRVVLVKAESRHTGSDASRPDAEDLAMRCEAAAFRRATANYALCEQALLLDPRNVRALVALATWQATRVSQVQSPDPQADLARAEQWVAKALDADPAYYAVHCAQAVVLEGRRKLRQAIASAQRCLELNPSSPVAYRILALHHFFLADPQKTLEYAERGLHLSPRDPEAPTFLLFMGHGYALQARDQEALAWYRRAAAMAPESPIMLAALAVSLVQAGHDEEAGATMARYLSLKRTQTRTIAQWTHQPDDNPEFERFMARFRAGLRRAGMPDK
jgi:adenylate cyclase